MKLKTLIITVVILAVISVAVYVAQRPAPPPSLDSRVGQPLADRAVVEKAAKLRLSDQGKTVILTRQSDGSWRDTSYHDLPADFSKLSTFVGNLTDAKLDRFVTANPERLSRLEFKDTKIELLDASDKPVWILTLGKSAETGSGRFVRYDDEKKAYLTSLNAWIDTDAKSWANSELLNLKADDVAKIEIDFPTASMPATEAKPGVTPLAPVTLSRAKKDGPWTADKTPTNEKVKADKVSSLLSYVTNIRFTDTSDLTDANAAAAKTHERAFKITTFDGKTYTVALGRKPEEKKLKPPTPSSDGKTGPASLGSVTDLAKKEEKAKEPEKSAPGEKKPAESKPVAPEFETIPAGPVFAFIASSDASAPVNAMMKSRAFQIGDYIFTSLPQKPEELFEAAPTPPPAPKPEVKKTPSQEAESGTKPADSKKPTAPAK